MTATLLEPGRIEPPAGDIPFLRLPAREHFFRDRAARFRQLAPGHKMGDFLAFMAHLAEAQHRALQGFPEVPLPEAEALKRARDHGMPPLAAQTWPRDPAWREALATIAEEVGPHAPEPAREALERLTALDADAQEALADALLTGRFADLDPAQAPFVAAALQTYWVHMVTRLGEAAFGRTDLPTLCPVCASPPVASLVRIGGAVQGLRYLQCSLCGSEWHRVRATCSNCDSSKEVAYYGIEGDKGAAKAEACEDCGSYLKIFFLDKDPQQDATADDLATLALDILMDEQGIHRSGPNLFLIAGEDRG